MDCQAIDVVDHISSLPDDIISNILSCLPTFEAMVTSVLLKDWKFERTFFHNIDIDDQQPNMRMKARAMFVKFMEKALLCANDSKRIRLELSSGCESSCVTSWINTLVSKDRNIESLHVNAITDGFEFNFELLNKDSLEELFLNVHALKVPSENCFPKLTSLFLGNAKIRKFGDGWMVLTCPVLKEITLAECDWSSVCGVKLHAPALKIFKSYPPLNAGNHELCYGIFICGAKLAVFSSKHNLETFFFTRTTVVSAALENVDSSSIYTLWNGFSVRRLLHSLSPFIEDLKIHCFLVEAIMKTKDGWSNLPIFAKLGRLVICSSYRHYFLVPYALFELLRCTRFLKTLVVDMHNCGVIGFEEVDIVPSIVPSCVKSSLEEVEFKTKCYKSLIGLARFLLKHGSELQRFHYQLSDDSDVQVFEELSSFPRAATHLNITVCVSHKQ